MTKKFFLYTVFLTYSFTNLLWLVIGLWPFKFFSTNNIVVDKKTHSLSFKENSFAYIHKSIIEKCFKNHNNAFSIELVIVPFRFTSRYVPRIISISDKHDEVIMIGQWKKNLIVRINHSGSKITEFGKENILSENKPFHVLIIYTSETVSLYIDGQLIKSTTGDFRWKNRIFEPHQITLGNTAFGNQQWYGSLLAFSIYNRPLLAGECKNHFSIWTKNNQSTENTNGEVFAYPSSDFHESQQLVIPKLFSPLQKKYLTPPWKEFKFESYYASDLILNFAAFVILGFLSVATYSHFSLKKTLLLLIAVGNSFLISIIIETLQIFLPSRTSQLSDLILNTLGGYTGGILYYYVVSFFKKILFML